MNCWLNCETTAVTRTVTLCCWGCNLVSQTLLMDIRMGSRCWRRLPFKMKKWCCSGKPFFFLLVMLCRLASASSSMLHSVVNHYPSPPLHPRASLSLPALRVWSGFFRGSPEMELRERPLLPPSRQECLALSRHTVKSCIIFKKKQDKQKNKGRGKRRRVTPICISEREHFWKKSFTKRGLWTTSCTLQFNSGVWENRSHTPEVCPSIWETMNKWRIIP